MDTATLPHSHGDCEGHLPDEAGIARLVHAFYARVRNDALLGPVFASAVEDWDQHLDTLVRFWCSVLMRAGTYRGNPMAAHRPHGLGEPHLARWPALWGDTAHDVLPAAQARHVVDTAMRIGRSLRIGLGIDPLRRLRRTAGVPACRHREAPDTARPAPAGRSGRPDGADNDATTARNGQPGPQSA